MRLYYVQVTLIINIFLNYYYENGDVPITYILVSQVYNILF